MMDTTLIHSNENLISSLANQNPLSTCYGCNQPITDQYLVKVLDNLWHEQCTRCYECETILNGKCFTRSNRLFCKPDFYRLFGVKCAGCDEGIYPSDMIRRLSNRIYHTSCLKCQHCEKEVSTGDQLYVIDDGSFVCKVDYENIMSGGEKPIKAPITPQKSSPPSTTDSDDLDDKPPSTSSNNDQQMSDEDDDANRRRGPRTTIKAKQLEVLKTAFLATPKPSRHIREKLSADTGLTMRVIQVWFQNRRSKERRVKQMSSQDIRRVGYRKNSMSKDGPNGLGYNYFPNGGPNPLDEFSQPPGFNFDTYNNNNNNNNNNNTMTSPNTNNNMSLPNDILQNGVKSKFDENSNDFSLLNSFTSQLQATNFNNFNFAGQLMPNYERL